MDRVSPAADTARPTRWRFPASRVVDIDNGLRVKLVDIPGQPVAAVGVVIAVPTAVERPGTEGVVSAYGSLLLSCAPHARTTGVGPLAQVGATVTSGCDHRGPRLMADCPVEVLPVLFDALAAMLSRFEPTAEDFQQWRLRCAAEKTMEQADPLGSANVLLHQSVLAPSSRYARAVSGTEQSLADLTVDDVVELYQRHVGPGVTTMVVVGDLGGLDIEAALRRSFGGWSANGCVAVVDQPPEPGGAPTLRWRPGSGGRTCVMMGAFAIDRLDPRWPAARIAAELLGGPTGLVNSELRGRLGASYGFDVRFLPYYAGGLFVVHGSVAEQHGETAVATIRAVVAALLRDGVDAQVFDAVRRRMADRAPELYESALAVLHQCLELESCGIDESFIDRHLSAVLDLDHAQWIRDLRTLLDPDGLHTAVVGRFDPDASVLAGLPRA